MTSLPASFVSALQQLTANFWDFLDSASPLAFGLPEKDKYKQCKILGFPALCLFIGLGPPEKDEYQPCKYLELPAPFVSALAFGLPDKDEYQPCNLLGSCVGNGICCLFPTLYRQIKVSICSMLLRSMVAQPGMLLALVIRCFLDALL